METIKRSYCIEQFAKQVDGIIFMGHRITDDIRGEFSRSKHLLS